MFANAHFKGPEDPAWEPDDFLTGGNYRERAIEARRQRVQDERELRKQIAIMKAPLQIEAVPEWAKVIN